MSIDLSTLATLKSNAGTLNLINASKININDTSHIDLVNNDSAINCFGLSSINLTNDSSISLFENSYMDLVNNSSVFFKQNSNIKLQPTGSVGIMTISPSTFAANRTITVYDPLSDSSLQLGSKKIQTPNIIDGTTPLTRAMSSNQIYFTNGSSYSINLPTLATSAGVSYTLTQSSAQAAFTVTIHSVDGVSIMGMIRRMGAVSVVASSTNINFLTNASTR